VGGGLGKSPVHIKANDAHASPVDGTTALTFLCLSHLRRLSRLSRDAIAKMCRYSAPPGYVRSKASGATEARTARSRSSTRSLEADKTAPPRHIAKRIFERLRIEHGYAGGYTVVKDYVRIARTRSREVFIPLARRGFHPACSSARPRAGRCRRMRRRHRRRAHEAACVLFRPAQSDACFIEAYPARPRKPSSTTTSLHLRFSAACRSRFYMTISKSQWRACERRSPA
jgi:hypothetical protein